MQRVLQPTIGSGICAVGMVLLSPHRPRPLLSLSPPNFIMSLKSGKLKPLLSPLASYDPLNVKRSKLFSRRVSSFPVSPGFTFPNDESDKAHLDQEKLREREEELEVFKLFLRHVKKSRILEVPICLHLATHVLQNHAAKGSNTVISPFSFRILLSLIAAGSKGHTLQQLFQHLKSESLEDLNSLSSKTISLASPANESNTDDPDLSFINGVWVGEGVKLERSFQDTVEVISNATAKEVDFVNKADQVAAETNVWIETATRGLIKNLLTSEALKAVDKDTALILANALDFKGTWAQCFDTSETKNRPFYLEKGQTVDVPFMINEKCESFHYVAFNGLKILRLPYKNGQSTRKFAMYFILPDAIDGLQEFVDSLYGGAFFNQRFSLPHQNLTEIWIPRFKFSFEFEASDAMKELGLNLPFDSTKADITEMVDPSRRLYVNKMLHKAFIEVNEEETEAAAPTAGTCRAFIEVNEEGTEAAAHTAVADRPVCLRPPTRSFVADHPFIFMIKEETSGVVFFLGAVVNPLLQS
ncbi:hypothetical protein PTKIN_Ptkin15bG0186800 [Pterospermum kingtungense]